MYIYSIAVGLVTGFLAVLFTASLKFFEDFYLTGVMERHAEIPMFPKTLYLDWVLLGILLLGALINGVINHFFCSESAGSGIDYIIDRFHNHEGRMKNRIAFYKYISTMFTLGLGGSGGKEGPIAQIGAGVGAMISNSLDIGPRARRGLLLAGSAAGLGAVFHTPLAGAITSVEMLYREDIESDSLIPCIIASIVSYLVTTFFVGNGPIYKVDHLYFNLHDIPAYAFLGLVCYGSGFLFVRMFEYITQKSKDLKLHPVLKPMVGILLLYGIVALFPQVLGTGSEYLQDILSHSSQIEQKTPIIVAGFFFLLAICKMIATSVTVGSGFSAGLYGPSLLIGASLGLGTAALQKSLFPGLDVSYSSFALVGMGAFYAGIASAPIAAILFVAGLVGNYILLPPMIIVAVITLVLSHKWTIYRKQLANRFESPAHTWSIKTDFLKKVSIEDSQILFQKIAVINEGITLKSLRKKGKKIKATDFLVLKKGKYSGFLSLNRMDVSAENENAKAADYMNTNIVPLDVSESLATALRIMAEREIDKIPVEKNAVFYGYIRYKNIVDYYFSNIEKR